MHLYCRSRYLKTLRCYSAAFEGLHHTLQREDIILEIVLNEVGVLFPHYTAELG